MQCYIYWTLRFDDLPTIWQINEEDINWVSQQKSNTNANFIDGHQQPTPFL